MKAPIPLVGGCACGDVRYEVTRASRGNVPHQTRAIGANSARGSAFPRTAIGSNTVQ
jgi:hypothetical protein